jgi:hypothetical protein
LKVPESVAGLVVSTARSPSTNTGVQSGSGGVQMTEVVRTVTENCRTLKFDSFGFEER